MLCWTTCQPILKGGLSWWQLNVTACSLQKSADRSKYVAMLKVLPKMMLACTYGLSSEVCQGSKYANVHIIGLSSTSTRSAAAGLTNYLQARHDEMFELLQFFCGMETADHAGICVLLLLQACKHRFADAVGCKRRDENHFRQRMGTRLWLGG